MGQVGRYIARIPIGLVVFSECSGMRASALLIGLFLAVCFGCESSGQNTRTETIPQGGLFGVPPEPPNSVGYKIQPQRIYGS